MVRILRSFVLAILKLVTVARIVGWIRRNAIKLTILPKCATRTDFSGGLSIDELDKQILGYLIRDKKLTAAELVERVFEYTDKYDRHKKYSKLRSRAERLVGDGLLQSDKSKKYSLADCVICDESSITLHTSHGDVCVDAGPVLMFERSGGDFALYFLDQP